MDKDRDYSEDRHELLPEDQAHMDSIREEINGQHKAGNK